MKAVWLVLLCVALGCQAAPLTVTEVIAADCVVLSDHTKVYYAGLCAPESESPWFTFCQEANVFLVDQKKVKIVVEPGDARSEGMAAYVYTPILVGDEMQYLFVNAEMAKFGFAKVPPVPPSAQYPERWQMLWNLQEQEAKPWKQGIWSGGKPREYKLPGKGKQR
jgi:endonuclease YncB( thermonuclease family)